MGSETSRRRGRRRRRRSAPFQGGASRRARWTIAHYLESKPLDQQAPGARRDDGFHRREGAWEGGREATYLRVEHIVGDALVGDDLGRVRPQELGDAFWKLGHRLMLRKLEVLLLLLLFLRARRGSVPPLEEKGESLLTCMEEREGKEGKDENIQIVNVPACGRCCRAGRSLTSWLVHCWMSRPPLSPLHHELAPCAAVMRKKKGTDRVKGRHYY